MGTFCKRKPKRSPSGSTSDKDTGKNASTSTAPQNSALQDLQMDLGIIDKNQAYYRDLEDRQIASQDALNKLKENKSDRNKAKAAAAAEEAEAEAEEEVNEEEEADTVLDEETNEALEDVEEIADDTFGGGQEEGEVDPTDDTSNYFDNTATSAVNTAAGIDTNIASALTTSVGEAEDEAISYMDSGTASNVVNTGGSQGLLAGDDEDEFDPFNRRKTLIGA